MGLRPPFLDAPGIFFSELMSPSTNRFTTYINSALSQQFLYIPVAHCKSKIKPYGLFDDVRMEAMTVIGDFFHENHIA
ncbi:MAG: hypothetical protein COB36_11415 [Alphaproteobacteria bacterium]|nr:MAG: hypothetical protein COB36_11415 [Alphaproteobacteria bacterium]